MTPRTSLSPFSPRPSLAAVSTRSVGVVQRPGWKRFEVSLGVTAVAGVLEVIVASWIVAIATRDLLTGMHAEMAATTSAFTGAMIARLGLVVAEAISALAISTAAGLLLLRCEIRPSATEAIPFWTRVVAAVRFVGGSVVFGLTWKLGWAVVLESTVPWLLLLLAAVQLAALVAGSFRPQDPRRPAKTA